MQKLNRFVIYLGIGIGVTLFGMLLYGALPNMIQYQSAEWERLGNGGVSNDDEVMALYMAHPAYIAFYETYPDAKEELNKRHRGNSELQVGIMDFDTNNMLRLDMNYDQRDDRMRVNVRCDTMDGERDLRADGLFAEDFIRNTECLSIVKENADAETTDVIITPMGNGLMKYDIQP